MARIFREPAVVLACSLLMTFALTISVRASDDFMNGIWWKGLTHDQKVIAVVAGIGTYHFSTWDTRKTLTNDTGFSHGPSFYVAAIDDYYAKPNVETTSFGSLIVCLADKPRTPELCRTLYGL